MLLVGMLIAVAVWRFLPMLRTDEASSPARPGPVPSATAGAPVDESGPAGTPDQPATTVLGGRDGQFSADGVSFTFPQAWQGLQDVDYRLPDGDVRWVTSVGMDEENFATVSKYRIELPLPLDEAGRWQLASSMAIEMALDTPGGEVLYPLEAYQLDLPAWAVALVDPHAAGGAGLERQWVVLFGDEYQYVVECQSTEADGPTMSRGCTSLVRSFTAES